jgi:thioredoxin-related protein
MKNIIFFLLLLTLSIPAMAQDKIKKTAVSDSLLTLAKSSNKNVLVEFRAEWCKWCKRLEASFRKEKIKAILDSAYVIARYDIGKYDRNTDIAAYYGLDLKKSGIPALIVLDCQGKVLKIKDTGELEEGEGHSESKIIDFLKAYSK